MQHALVLVLFVIVLFNWLSLAGTRSLFSQADDILQIQEREIEGWPSMLNFARHSSVGTVLPSNSFLFFVGLLISVEVPVFFLLNYGIH